MLAWMGYAMIAAAALGVTAWLIDFAVPGRFGRHRVLWAGVFLASAIGPILFSVTRDIPTAVVAEEEIGATPAASGRSEPTVSDPVLVSAWLATSAVLALWLVGTQRRLRRRLRGCPSRIVDGERVLVSDFGPVVVGIVRPQIVLPEWALAMRESDRRIIVAHEAEHRQAHDPLLAAMGLILVAAFPWNAALWWQLRRLRLAIEIDCDQRVVSQHAQDPHTYGMLLLATRERTSRVTPAMAMAMAPMRSGLGRRIEALVDGRPRSVVRRLSAVVAAGVVGAGIVSVPAPRLSIVRAAVVDTSAAIAPLPSSTAPQPLRRRQASPRSSAAEGLPRRSAPAAPVLPRRALTVVRFDSSLTRVARPMTQAAVARARWRMEDTGERRDRRGSFAPSVEGRWTTISVTPTHRLLRSRTAPNRHMLVPIPDSLLPSHP